MANAAKGRMSFAPSGPMGKCIYRDMTALALILWSTEKFIVCVDISSCILTLSLTVPCVRKHIFMFSCSHIQ